MNQTFERSLRAVPTQSLRARSKCESAPGPSEGAPDDGGDGAHAEEEWVDLDSLERCAGVYLDLARALCA